MLERVTVDAPRSTSLSSDSRTAHDPLQRRVAMGAAVLFAIGMVTGLWSGVALSGMVKVPVPHAALSAHLNCLLGSFWLLGFAWTLPMLSYDTKGKGRLATLILVATYSNWFVTLVKSFLGVHGLTFIGEIKNDAIAFLLFTLVVGPALVSSIAWANGFRKPAH
jgi:hypothetical protein